MKFISRKKRKALEEKLAALDASSDEAREIRSKLGWGAPAPVVEEPPIAVAPEPVPEPEKVEAKPKADAKPAKPKTTKKKTGLFGKKTSTKK